MIRIRALTIRIFLQLLHDKRTLGIMFVLPLLLITLIWLVLKGTDNSVIIGVVDTPKTFTQILEKNDNIEIKRYGTWENAQEALEKEDVIAIVKVSGLTEDMLIGPEGGVNIDIVLDGTKGSSAVSIKKLLETASESVVLQALQKQSEMQYWDEDAPTGTESLQVDLSPYLSVHLAYLDDIRNVETFDVWGGTIIGFVTFFLVFILAGMTFLKERRSGTLEKLLSTPIQRHEIVAGYICGFGAVTILQSVIISLFVIKVLGIAMYGSIIDVLIIMIISTVCPLSLGMLLSTAANSEFQMMQFIPVVIVPQLFFSGLFNLSFWWELFGKIFPLTYMADALNKVILRGESLSACLFDLLVLILFSTIFVSLNIRLLKKRRSI